MRCAATCFQTWNSSGSVQWQWTLLRLQGLSERCWGIGFYVMWFCVNGISSPLMPSQNGKAENGAHSVKQQLKKDPDSSSDTLQALLSSRATRTWKISSWASEEIHQNLKYLQKRHKMNYDTILRWECERKRPTSTLVNICKHVTLP